MEHKANFNLRLFEADDWEGFKSLAKKRGMSANSALRALIQDAVKKKTLPQPHW